MKRIRTQWQRMAAWYRRNEGQPPPSSDYFNVTPHGGSSSQSGRPPSAPSNTWF